MQFDFPYLKWLPRTAQRARFNALLQRRPPHYLFRDRILRATNPGELHDSTIYPGSPPQEQVRLVVDTEGLGYALPPIIHLPPQETPVWNELCLTYPMVWREPGCCMVVLLHPTDQDACFAAGLAASILTGDPRSNGTGFQMENKQLGVVTPRGHLNLLGQRGARPLPYHMVIVINDIGTLVLLSTLGDTTGLGMDDPLGIPAFPLARLAWVDYSDTSSGLIPYISQYAPYAVNMLDLRVLNVPEWAQPDALAAFSDRFTRLNSSTSLGNGWSALSGVFGITSNQAYQVSGGGRTLATHTTGLVDGDALWHYRVVMPAGQIECCLRIKDAANYIFLWINNTTICLARLVGGSYAPIASTAGSFTLGQTFEIDVLSIGNRYAVWVNSVNAFNTWLTDDSSSHLQETQIGIGAWANPSGELFDNIACYPLLFELPLELHYGACPPFRPGVDVIAQDSFTHAGAAPLSEHTPEAGGAWSEQAGAWNIQENRLTASGETPAAFATQQLDSVNAELQVELHTPASGASFFAGITTRFVDPDNCFVVRILMSPDQPASDEVELQCVLEGAAETQKYNLGDYFAPDSTYTLKVHSRGGWITAWLDGQPLLSHRCMPDEPAGTQHGLYRDLALDAGCTFDNWLAKSL